MYYKDLFRGDLRGDQKLDLVESLLDALNDKNVHYVRWTMGNDFDDLIIEEMSFQYNESGRLGDEVYVKYDFILRTAYIKVPHSINMLELHTDDAAEISDMVKKVFKAREAA